MFRLFYNLLGVCGTLFSVHAATTTHHAVQTDSLSGGVGLQTHIGGIKTQAFPIAPVERQDLGVRPMWIDLRNTPFDDLGRQMLQAVSSAGMVALNLSSRQMSDGTLEDLMGSLSEALQRGDLLNIVEIDLSDNNLTVAGVQSLLPIIDSHGFRFLNVTSNQLEGADLVKNLGTYDADDEVGSADDRVYLDADTRSEVLRKLIWLPKCYFDPNGQPGNPSGMYVTPDVIQRHREYYGVAHIAH